MINLMAPITVGYTAIGVIYMKSYMFNGSYNLA